MHKILTRFFLMVSGLLLVSCSPAFQTGMPIRLPPPQPLPRYLASPTPAAMVCTILHAPTTPEALPAELGDRVHATGPADAPVTIVVFSDYQCPYCALLSAVLKQIRLAHPDDVRLVYVNTPLSSRDKDALATQAAEAADLQGKFWEMHDLLFDKEAEWSALAPADFPHWAMQQAANLGMDQVEFQSDF